MALLGDEARASRDHLPELNCQIETASFKVLAQLCSRSKARNVVTKAENFDECVLYAMKIESSMVESSAVENSMRAVKDDEPPKDDDEPVKSIGTDDEVSRDETEPVAGASMKVDSDAPSNANDDPATGAPTVTLCPHEDASLEVAVFEFLSSLLPVEKFRSTLLCDKDFIHASLALAKCSPSSVLKSAAVQFVVAISPYAKRDQSESLAFSAGELMEVFRGTLHLDTVTTFSADTANTLQNAAMEGAERMFDEVSSPFQCSVIAHAVERFTRLVKSITRPSKGDACSGNCGLLACSMTLLMLRSVGNKDVQSLLFTGDLLTPMVQLTQWCYDPKLRSEEQDPLHWEAAVCQCLQIIAFVFRGTDERLQQAGVAPVSLARTVLMIARPGKAPRKAIDFKTALRRIIDEGTNAASIVAARRILSSLED